MGHGACNHYWRIYEKENCNNQSARRQIGRRRKCACRDGFHLGIAGSASTWNVHSRPIRRPRHLGLGGTWPKPGDACPGKIQRPNTTCPETDLFGFAFSRFWSGPNAACPGTDLFLCFFFFFFFFFWSGPAFAEDFFFSPLEVAG